MDGLNGDGGEQGGMGMGGFQMMGIMNALKTGDVQTDMLIAMCIPFLLRFFFNAINNADPMHVFTAFGDWWRRTGSDHHRYITYKCTRSSWGSVYNMDNDSQNSVLLKAIRLYIDQVLKLRLKAAGLQLTGTEAANSGISSNNYDSDDEDSNSGGSRRTMVGVLSRYKIIQTLPDDEWHNLGCFGNNIPAVVKLRVETVQQSEGDNKESSSRTNTETTTFHFTSPQEGAIDGFVETAYSWYLEELRKMEDNARYYYELKVSVPKVISSNSDDGGGSGEDGAVYKRYKLSDQKQFDSLFFRQKESMLSLIKHFTDRTGKYAISGYPHKLGLLLHGPPGTGKTSLIKALAHHTGRSIINVPLTKVSTNSELMSIFFDKKYHVEGADVPVSLNFKDVIFVMEDVDAASKVVKRRDGMKTADVVQTETVDLPLPKSLWRMLLESNDGDCRELVELLMEKSERLKEEAQRPEVLRGIAQRMMTLPGLGLVGEAGDDATLSKLSQEAVDAAGELMNQYSTVEQFVSGHAKSIKALIEAGTDLDDTFIDDLLGLSTEGPISLTRSPQKGQLSRNVSYTKYNEREEVELGQDGAKGNSSMMAAAGMAKMLATSEAAGSAGGFGGGGDKEMSSAMIGPSFGFGKKNKDALSLAGLLNVLDGVVDTPSRMLIMTTNHPEMLDPALVRPGRIDKKIMLGYMESEDVISMLQHYFEQELDETQKALVTDIMNNESHRLKLTPAQIEQMTAEHDTLETMIEALSDMAQPAAHSRTKFGRTSMATLTYSV